MIEGLFQGSNYATSKALLDMTAARHEVLAGNIANVHTPGYKRIDVTETFMDQLKTAIAKQDVPELLDFKKIDLAEAHGFEAQDSSGNNVNLEQEMMFLSENSFAYQMNAQLVSSSLRRLETAITGRTS